MAVDSARHTGWKWDILNGYLEVFVRGTRVAYFDDATNDLRLLTNGMTVDSGGVTVSVGGVTVSAGGATITGNSTYADDLTFSDYFYHANAVTETLTTHKTFDILDSGKIFLCATDSLVFTLPEVDSGTMMGCCITVINTQTSDSSVGISISPFSDDKIMGPDIAGADDKDIINTKATSAAGDMIRLIADGTNGWYVDAIHGTWAAEA